MYHTHRMCRVLVHFSTRVYCCCWYLCMQLRHATCGVYLCLPTFVPAVGLVCDLYMGSKLPLSCGLFAASAFAWLQVPGSESICTCVRSSKGAAAVGRGSSSCVVKFILHSVPNVHAEVCCRRVLSELICVRSGRILFAAPPSDAGCWST